MQRRWIIPAIVLTLLVVTKAKHLATESGCGGGAVDMVFALDSSHSVWEVDFTHQLAFVQNLIQHFTVGETAVRVGVLTFGTNVYPRINLGDYFSSSDLITAIGAIPVHTRGGTNTGAAVKYAREVMLSTENGGRKNVPKLNIVITDGNPLYRENTTLEASISHSVGIHMIAVGAGYGVDRSELRYIASRADNGDKMVFTAEDFSGLQKLEKLVLSAICNAVQNDEVVDPAVNDAVGESANNSCNGTSADVYFLLDSSSSIRTMDFQKMLNFIVDVIDMFDLQSGATRVGVVGYSDGIHPYVVLKNDLSQSQLKTRLLNIAQENGGTKTGSALQYLKQFGFAHARKSVARVAILLTDGKSDDPETVLKESENLHKMGVHMFAIGIGPSVDVRELEAIAGRDSVFLISDFSALLAIKEALADSTYQSSSSLDDKGGLQADKGYSCEADVMYVYDRQSLPQQASDVILSTITDPMIFGFRTGTSIRTGILTQVCHSLTNLPIGLYQSSKKVKSLLTTYQEQNLPLLLKELRTKSFRSTNGGREGARKVAVLFLYGELNNFRQLHLEIRRLKFRGVEIFVVYNGRSLTRDVTQIASEPWDKHLMHVNEFDGPKLWKVLQENVCTKGP